METTAELVLKLQRPGIDLFEDRQHRAEIARRGREAVRDLLPLIPNAPVLVEALLLETVRGIKGSADREQVREDLEHEVSPGNHPSARAICMRLLGTQYPNDTHVGTRFLDFAANVQEPKEMRLCALNAASSLKPVSALGKRLVDLLHDADLDVVHKVLGILRSYSGLVPVEEVVHELERLASPTSSPVISRQVRCDAIELLGQFGEVDVLERVILLPLTHEHENEAVGRLVQHLLRKPRSVVRLTPKSFEHLVCRLLEQMRYDDVTVQRKESWDRGVDVLAWARGDQLGPERIKVIVQCKRYKRSNLVGPDVVDQMVKTLQEEGAAQGVIIVTSDFQTAAHERAQRHQHINLVSGRRLQELLDKHMGSGLYRVLD